MIHARCRRGAAATEFALFLPILVASLGISVDLGWYLWRHSIILDAAREGCRVGADTVDSSTGSGPASEADIEDAATDHALAVLGVHDLSCGAGCTITSTWETDRSSGYELLTVRVEYPFHPLIGMFEGIQGPVVAQFTMFSAVQI